MDIVNGSPLTEIIRVTASPASGVECFGERLGDFDDIDRILNEVRVEVAARNCIPAGRLLWKMTSKWLGANGSGIYELDGRRRLIGWAPHVTGPRLGEVPL